MGVVERVQGLVAPILADLGLELYDLEYGGGTVKVVLDRSGGIDLDELALATRLISRQLDHVDPIPGRYTLEITSPGLERQLRTPAHFRRAIDTKVNVRTLPHVAGERRVQGVLLAADEQQITILVGDPGPELGLERTIALVDIERARTVFEWGGAPKPGAGSKPGAAKGPGNKPGARPAKPAHARTPAADRTDEGSAPAGTHEKVTQEEGAPKP